jgi:hypothetical protein
MALVDILYQLSKVHNDLPRAADCDVFRLYGGQAAAIVVSESS